MSDLDPLSIANCQLISTWTITYCQYFTGVQDYKLVRNSQMAANGFPRKAGPGTGTDLQPNWLHETQLVIHDSACCYATFDMS